MLSGNVAYAVITPPVGTVMLEPPNTPTTGVADDLYCRVLYLNDGETGIAIVSLDLLGVDAALLKAIRQAVKDTTGLPHTHLMLTATHNHSAPITLDCGMDEHRNREWEDDLIGKIAECVWQAMQNLQNVTLSVAQEKVQIGVNRRVSVMGRTRMLANPHAPIAPYVDVLSVNRDDGTPMAVLFSHTAHPVTVHTASTQFNADYPGYAVHTIQEALGKDILPMFAQGCAGDINVVSLAGGLDEAKRLGGLLGQAVVKAVSNAKPIPTETIGIFNRFATLPFDVLSDNIIEALSQRIQESQQALSKLDVDERTHMNQQQLVDWIDHVRNAPDGLWFQVQGVALGEHLIMIAMPHEPFVAYQLHIKKTSPTQHTMVFGYANGCNGYVPTAEAFYLGGYEVDGAPKLFGLPRLHPDSEQIIYDAIDDIFEHLRS